MHALKELARGDLGIHALNRKIGPGAAHSFLVAAVNWEGWMRVHRTVWVAAPRRKKWMIEAGFG